MQVLLQLSCRICHAGSANKNQGDWAANLRHKPALQCRDRQSQDSRQEAAVLIRPSLCHCLATPGRGWSLLMAVNCYDRALLGPTSSGGSRPAQAVLTLQRAALRHARQLVNHPSCHFEHYSGSRPVRGQHLRVAAAAAPAAPAAPATGTKSAVTGSWPCKSGELVRFAALPQLTCSTARGTWAP